MASPTQPETLEKSLTLFDVYAISTGAMFSAGFFLLPGIATSYAGPSTILAYLLAGVLVLPVTFSQAELATAMPRAGGTYYFLDRSLGPMAGTIGGIGTWLALIFKSAFALVGMGAYLVFLFDLSIKPVAVALTVAFAGLNIIGAKETSGLQRVLVVTLLGILAFWVAEGLFEVFSMNVGAMHAEQFSPFLPFGGGGLLTTIGLVFVSYAGLINVASAAEEVQNPDRNIPLGMLLSLATATFVYVVGVYIMVAILPADVLREDLTPIATVAEQFMTLLPGEVLGVSVGVFLVVVSAIAAFVSTGNAGILSASRYPLAMARDRLVASRFAKIGRFGTPVPSIVITTVVMIFFILVLSAEGVAKLASAFNLFVFGLLNLAVIVMRESHIPSYAPGYRSPLYPWMQIVGVVTSVVLISTMGLISIGFTAGMIVACVAWYFYYARDHVVREGAIYHLFERLGRHRYDDLEGELHGILMEKEFRHDVSFERLVARAGVIDLENPVAYDDIVVQAAEILARRLGISSETVERGFREGTLHGQLPVSHGAALPHYRLPHLDHAELVLVRSSTGVDIAYGDVAEEDWEESDDPVYAFFFLVSPEEPASAHLRILAQLAQRIDDENFLTEWRQAEDEQRLKEVLLHYERFMSLHLREGTNTEDLINTTVGDLSLPANNLIALIRRGDDIIVPNGRTVLREGDRITVIGEPAGLKRLRDLYGEGRW